MANVFYDLNGKPSCYTDDGIHLFDFSGNILAYIDGDSIFHFSGKHLGWFVDGWIRDHNGACVFFSETANNSGPLKPLKQLVPLKSLKQLLPLKGLKELKPLKALTSISWSNYGKEIFFNRG